MHPTEGEGHGIRHADLFHLFFHVLQNVFDRHMVKPLYEGLVDHHWCGCRTRPSGKVPPGHEGKLGAVEFDVG